MGVKIHPTAIVSDGAEIGVDVEIGPYAIVGPFVKIGDRSRITAHAVIEGHTTLGVENVVYQFASVGAEPQDLKFKGEPSTLVIGDRNKIRECVTLHPGTATGTMTTIIGSGNLFMANSHVAHDCRVGNNNVFANTVALAGHVTIEDNVILGGMAGIHQFCRVGSFSIIGAGAMVALDIPPYCIGQGDRCVLRGINVIALQRAGMDTREIAEIRKVYRTLFVSGGRLQDKIAALPEDLKLRPRIRTFLDFLSETKRGICSTARNSVESD